MAQAIFRVSLLTISIFCLLLGATLISDPTRAQRGRIPPKEPDKKERESNPQDAKEQKQDHKQDSDDTALKIDAMLVAVPVVVNDRNGIYVPNLKTEDFMIFEDKTQQEITFFSAVKEPFDVVLMLDTSGSTKEKLGQIQAAAITFVNQLLPADRVMVISFDDHVYQLSDFTNDRKELEKAIRQTRPRQGTHLYDAVYMAVKQVKKGANKRRAIILFTDGVDWHSEDANYNETVAMVEEAGVLVYPIRYETRAETEAMLREQERNGNSPGAPPADDTPPIGSGRYPGGGTGGGGTQLPTPPTMPGGRTGPSIPQGPPVIIYSPRDPRSDPRDPRYDPRRDPNDPRYDPTDPRNDRYPPGRYPDDPNYPGRRTPYPSPRRDDSISVMLNSMYRTADQYLKELADKSGGKLHRADTLGNLPAAFSFIAEELRHQYVLGYYPTNAKRDGRYRRISVQLKDKSMVARARPGYRAPEE